MSDEPEWTEEQKARQPGATTFKTCGWCKHHGGGLMRFNCLVSGSCDLLESYKNDVKWDTPCKIATLGKKDIQDLIGHKTWEIKQARAGIKSTEAERSVLKGLLTKADDIPPLPDRRKSEHFRVGKKVMVWLHEQHEWVETTVVAGYRTYDGCVSFARGGGCGNAIPGVLLKSEYQFFAKNPKKWKVWIETACDKTFNGERIDPNSIEPPAIVFMSEFSTLVNDAIKEGKI